MIPPEDPSLLIARETDFFRRFLASSRLMLGLKFASTYAKINPLPLPPRA